MARYDCGNFVSVKWANVKKGDTVWLEGTNLGQRCFYGPHMVCDPEKRELKNSFDRRFLDYPETLHKEIEKMVNKEELQKGKLATIGLISILEKQIKAAEKGEGIKLPEVTYEECIETWREKISDHKKTLHTIEIIEKQRGWDKDG